MTTTETSPIQLESDPRHEWDPNNVPKFVEKVQKDIARIPRGIARRAFSDNIAINPLAHDIDDGTDYYRGLE